LGLRLVEKRRLIHQNRYGVQIGSAATAKPDFLPDFPRAIHIAHLLIYQTNSVSASAFRFLSLQPHRRLALASGDRVRIAQLNWLATRWAYLPVERRHPVNLHHFSGLEKETTRPTLLFLRFSTARQL
jgi:hypothetical protein